MSPKHISSHLTARTHFSRDTVALYIYLIDHSKEGGDQRPGGAYV